MTQGHAAAPPRYIVVGAGIAGLAAAFQLRQFAPAAELLVLEGSDRVGGVLQTEHEAGYLLEQGADNFITNVPWALQLCQQLGLEADLVRTDQRRRRTLVVCRGKLEPIPEGFMLMAPARLAPLLRTPILSPRGKARLMAELFIRPSPTAGEDESLASFVRRRLGDEAFERLVQPLVGGIYTADAEQLSLKATLPRFLEMERRHGGLIRATLAARRQQQRGVAGSAETAGSGARYGLFCTPRSGMEALPRALAEKLPAGTMRLERRVTALRRVENVWEVTADDPAGNRETLTAQGVILALPAYHSADLLQPLDETLAGQLAGIPYASSAVALLGYRRGQIGHPLDGFGFVVPAVENRRILACSFSSVKYPGRAPVGEELLRVFIGGAGHEDLLTLPDDELLRIAREEVADLLTIQGAPVLAQLRRWNRAMPQYHLGHLDRVAAIHTGLDRWPGLALAGAAYEGVGIPHCIASGQAAAKKISAVS